MLAAGSFQQEPEYRLHHGKTYDSRAYPKKYSHRHYLVTSEGVRVVKGQGDSPITTRVNLPA